MVRMKLSKLRLLFLIIISLLFLSSSCEKPTENEPCENTKWEASINQILEGYIGVPKVFCDAPRNTLLSWNAEQIVFTGTIQKFYCGDIASGSFSMNDAFTPRAMSEEQLAKVGIGQAYDFKFENDKDYLRLTGTLTAYFLDDVTWKTKEFSVKIYHKDLIYDFYNVEHYYVYAIPWATVWEVVPE
jgi:hypothetical protein